jgi:hypothetical protein
MDYALWYVPFQKWFLKDEFSLFQYSVVLAGWGISPPQGLYLGQHKGKRTRRQISTPRMRRTIPVFEKTLRALHSAATEIGIVYLFVYLLVVWSCQQLTSHSVEWWHDTKVLNSKEALVAYSGICVERLRKTRNIWTARLQAETKTSDEPLDEYSRLFFHKFAYSRCYCCACIRYRGNVSTEPLPSNDRGDTHTHTHSNVI